MSILVRTCAPRATPELCLGISSRAALWPPLRHRPVSSIQSRSTSARFPRKTPDFPPVSSNFLEAGVHAPVPGRQILLQSLLFNLYPLTSPSLFCPLIAKCSSPDVCTAKIHVCGGMSAPDASQISQLRGPGSPLANRRHPCLFQPRHHYIQCISCLKTAANSRLKRCSRPASAKTVWRSDLPQLSSTLPFIGWTDGWECNGPRVPASGGVGRP